MKVNIDLNPTVWRKYKNRISQIRWIYFWCKANVKRFGFNNLHQDFDIMGIVHTAMDVFRANKSK